MEGQTSDSLSEQQCLETKLTNMLQDVEPPEMHVLDMHCIYKVPVDIRETNPKAYTPQIVSIGPFHKASDDGKEDSIFESMEELKVNYLKAFLNRTQIPMGTLVDTLQKLEDDIRSCYAVRIKYNSDDFLKMILIDACFIIEHFLRYHTYHDWKGKDPVLLKDWKLIKIWRDLILLENQLPFFVLEELYNLTGMNREFPSFLQISFNCLKYVGLGHAIKCPTEAPKHFTDLLRTCIILSSKFDFRAQEECKEIKHVYSASQLREAGLKFKVSPNKGLLDLTYSSEGVLTMPILNIDDNTEMFFRNIVAFENCQFSYNENVIAHQYQKILDFLIDTEKDVNLLIDKKIMVNWMGDANAVVTMVNNLGTNLPMPYFNSHYYSLCKSLNDFYESPRNKYKAIFIHEYFNTPWKIASTVAAIVLLLLTLIQTICSIISLL